MTKQTRLRALDRQVGRVEGRIVQLKQTSARYSWLRLVVFLVGMLAVGLAYYFVGWWLAGICAVVTALLFGLVVYAHRQVERSIRRHRIWREIRLAQIARATLDWEGIPRTFHHRPRPEHPFEADLDLVGTRSVHRLLDTAVSHEGSQRLRAWLTAQVPDAGEIARRQGLVRELVPRSLFRDKLTLNAMDATGGHKTWEAGNLVDWLEGHGAARSTRSWLLLLGGMAALNAALFLANMLGLIPPWWQVTLVLYLGLMLARSREVAAVWEEARALEDALQQLQAVFHHLESFSYQGTPHLRSLCQPLLDAEHRPSRYLARVTQVVAALGVRGNPLIWFALNAVVPWDLYFADRLDRYKAAMAGRAPAWLDVWFELEALSSLANFAYLNPGYAFPEILVEAEEGEGPVYRAPVFRGRGLGHPLIPDDERVGNDFAVPELGQVTVITGSNMAGKSVFLKTVGVNLALAYAGGPVSARSLETVLFRLFTSMAIADSVTDGISYFYAEVKRLKALLAELEGEQALPLFFFIDEIFRGTNNRERLAGSRAYVRALAGQPGVGLIATHDLELARLADGLPRVVNHHFRDRVVDGRMAFDYVLRPGPCPTTNALTIMELEGLPVPARPGRPPPTDPSPCQGQGGDAGSFA